MSDSWYSHVEAEIPLTQGDLISDCPVIAWAAGPLNLSGSEESEILKGATIAIQADVIVMTQACDIENIKVENVIMCPHISISEYRQLWEADMRKRQQSPTTRAWSKIL